MLKRFSYLLILAFFLYLIPVSLAGKVRTVSRNKLSPITSFFVRQNIAIYNTLQSIGQIPHLREERITLQERVVSLEQQIRSQEDFRRENESLRKELAVTGVAKESKKVLARIIIQGSDPLDHTFLVDLGSNQGLKIGQPAVQQGFLIGKVISLNETTAVIRTLSSKQSQTQAWIASTHEKGRLVGDGNHVYLQDITQGIEIKNGELIETSGLGGSLPQGIAIGRIDQVQSKKSDLSQSFSVILGNEPNSLESVFILLVDPLK